ncbi:MAG TPA: NUDIX hydrolase, partial [Blastocatellia bacterium]|nr:NUDIX hydrolase [Blastocatellia bacterium]
MDQPRPSVTVDLVILTIAEQDLKVLLIRRGEEPFKGRWALPGGFVEIDESLERAAARELKEEVGVRDVYLEQLYTFGDPKRDPRGRVVSVVYFALVDAGRQRIAAA